MSIMRPEGGWNVTRSPVHPGEMLREEFMKPLGLSANALALALRVPEVLDSIRRAVASGSAQRVEFFERVPVDRWLWARIISR